MGRRRRAVSIGGQYELFRDFFGKKRKKNQRHQQRKEAERKLILRKRGKHISELIWKK